MQICSILSLKFDCEKLAQEKLEVHRQYVMVRRIRMNRFLKFI